MPTTATITQPRGQLTPVYTAIIPIDGLAPNRLPSAEETDRGVVSFDPPTARAFSPRALVNASVDAVSLAWIASGLTLDSGGYVALATRVAIEVKRALVAADPTVAV